MEIFDSKYRTVEPNISCCPDTNASNFWKGVLWAAKAMKFGYRWMVGNGRKNIWFGTSPLAVQFWDLYSVVNEKGKTISVFLRFGLTLDNQIRCSFRRTFSDTLMLRWYELEGIMQHLNMSNEEDALIWQYESNGHYSAKSLYAIINFRDVLPIYVPAIWSYYSSF